MDSFIPGWKVTRTISPEVRQGIRLGIYKVYGGVVRWAQGTPKAGQIVLHLISIGVAGMSPGLSSVMNAASVIPELVNSYQLMQSLGDIKSLIGTTQDILNVASGTMILSGLNLTVSALSFGVIYHKMTVFEKRLEEVLKEVREIRQFLELTEFSEMRSAIRDLLKIDETIDAANRHTILHNSRKVLAKVSERYGDLLVKSDTIEKAVAYEDFFCLALLGQVRCTADLGELAIAQKELSEGFKLWQKETRRLVSQLLLHDKQRFLYSDSVDEVPMAVLVDWLDFAADEEKGFAWVDELRRQNRPWFSDDSFDPFAKAGGFFEGLVLGVQKAVEAQPALNLAKQAAISAGIPMKKLVSLDLATERRIVIPTLKKLVARNKVLQGYLDQYKLLEAANMKPSEFSRYITNLTSEQVDGYIILEPTK